MGLIRNSKVRDGHLPKKEYRMGVTCEYHTRSCVMRYKRNTLQYCLQCFSLSVLGTITFIALSKFGEGHLNKIP